jgi:hypothetical protein
VSALWVPRSSSVRVRDSDALDALLREEVPKEKEGDERHADRVCEPNVPLGMIQNYGFGRWVPANLPSPCRLNWPHPRGDPESTEARFGGVGLASSERPLEPTSPPRAAEPTVSVALSLYRSVSLECSFEEIFDLHLKRRTLYIVARDPRKCLLLLLYYSRYRNPDDSKDVETAKTWPPRRAVTTHVRR